ncbi:MAG: hypothetical protein K0R53_2321 [Burkholderiales bacterium]|jgi:hypothetical protein|nr:hypothetical protein [Burkholderiales bacterium]
MSEEKLPTEEELAALDAACQKAMRSIADARTVREVTALDDVEVPHHLRAIAYSKVPALGRLRRLRDNRVEEIVQHQLHSLRVQGNDLVASREFDRIKASDWYVLRSNYPELYVRSLREANLILERKRQRK